jgi:phosphotransferase system enzyme I (PtsP)
MAATSIGPVKAMLLGLDAGQLEAEMNAALDDIRSQEPIRELLLKFAEANNIPL